MLAEKKFGSKNFGKKKFGSKKKLVQRKFGSNCFWLNKNLGPMKSGSGLNMYGHGFGVVQTENREEKYVGTGLGFLGFGFWVIKTDNTAYPAWL